MMTTEIVSWKIALTVDGVIEVVFIRRRADLLGFGNARLRFFVASPLAAESSE